MQRTRFSRGLVFAALVPFFLAATSFVASAQFSASTGTLAGGGGPEGIVSGDVNGDGNLDVVTTNYGTDDISVLLGDGAGNFTPSLINYASPFGTTLGGLVLFDATGDHGLDLVAATFYNPGFGVLLGAGGGAFGAPSPVSLPNTCSQVLAGDFNNDGKSDLLGSSYAADEFELALNAGGGSFTYSLSIPFGPPFGTNLGRIAIADFDQNGTLDFVSATYYVAGFGVAYGDGTGNFPTVIQTVAGVNTEAAAVGDIDQDGKPDVVVLDTLGNQAIVYLNSGGGTFTAGPSSPTTGSSPFGVAVASVTGDSTPDIVVSELGADVINVFAGTGGGNFAAGVTTSTGVGPDIFVVGDFNADGHTDVATADSGSDTVTLLTSTIADPTGIGSFGTGTGGCNSHLGMTTNVQAVIGTPTFGLVCTNAPRGTLGLGMLASAPDISGSDPFAFGILLQVNPFTLYDAVNFASDSQGTGFAAIPLPNSTGLIGVTTYAQALWVETPFGEACTLGIFGAVTSKGLSITIF